MRRPHRTLIHRLRRRGIATGKRLPPPARRALRRAKSNRSLIEEQFGRTIANKFRHTPQPQQRSVVQHFEGAHPQIFSQVIRSRLRRSTDYSLPSSLIPYYAFAQRQAVIGRISFGYMDLALPEPEVTLARRLQRRDLLCLCVDDSGGDANDHQKATVAILHRFVESYLPLPRRCERKYPHTQAHPTVERHS